mgnify:CR=1 FL=1
MAKAVEIYATQINDYNIAVGIKGILIGKGLVDGDLVLNRIRARDGTYISIKNTNKITLENMITTTRFGF